VGKINVKNTQSGFSTLSIVLILISVSLIFIDMYQRFLITQNDFNVSFVVEELAPIKIVQLSTSQLEDIKQKYVKFSQNTNVNSTVDNSVVLTAEQQAQQKGVLTQVFVGDNVLKLKAVISQKNKEENVKHIIVEVTNVRDGTQKIQSIVDRQVLFGYRIKIVDNTRVILNNVNSQQIVDGINDKSEITLVMYEQ
jgi:hypothetical protein